MQNALTSSLKHLMEKPGLHVAAAWCSGSGIITGQCFASRLRSRSIFVTRKEVFPHISCCLFQELGCVMGQHISLGPARRCCPYISAGMLLHALKPLLVLQHPLKSCCQGPIVKQTFFNPLLTPLAATFLAKKESVLMAAGTSLCWTGGTADSSCRLAPSLAGSFWGWKRNTFYGEQMGCLLFLGLYRKSPTL